MTKFCTVVPDICGILVWNLLYVTFVAFRILKCLIMVVIVITFLFYKLLCVVYNLVIFICIVLFGFMSQGVHFSCGLIHNI
jgi:hypothetical protein